jgi:hypothetical protein
MYRHTSPKYEAASRVCRRFDAGPVCRRSRSIFVQSLPAYRYVLKDFELPTMARQMENSSLLNDDLKFDLGALGYPGYAYLGGRPPRDPVQFLACAFDQPELDARVVEALPWVTYTYALEMDWERLAEHAKQHGRQNRLGFVVTTAAAFAEQAGDHARSETLNHYRKLLDRSRLDREDTLCHDSMSDAVRTWLRDNRNPEARYWNLLTDLDLKHVEPLNEKSFFRG